jgi:hypothetical protein
MRSLSGEQQRMLAWAYSIGAVSADALARREGWTVSSAQGRLLSAQRAGLLERSRPLAAVPSLYAPTREGMRAIGLRPHRPASVTAANAQHASCCAEVAVALERSYAGHRAIGEAELRRASGQWARLHNPDLLLLDPRGGPPLAVEVELTLKSPARLRRIFTAWARCRLVAGVLYVAPEQLHRPLQRAIAHAHAERRVALVELSSLVPRPPAPAKPSPPAVLAPSPPAAAAPDAAAAPALDAAPENHPRGAVA